MKNLETESKAKKPEKTVNCVGLNEISRVAFLKIEGYEVGDKIELPFAMNEDFSFEVNGENPQTVNF